MGNLDKAYQWEVSVTPCELVLIPAPRGSDVVPARMIPLGSLTGAVADRSACRLIVDYHADESDLSLEFSLLQDRAADELLLEILKNLGPEYALRTVEPTSFTNVVGVSLVVLGMMGILLSTELPKVISLFGYPVELGVSETSGVAVLLAMIPLVFLGLGYVARKQKPNILEIHKS